MKRAGPYPGNKPLVGHNIEYGPGVFLGALSADEYAVSFVNYYFPRRGDIGGENDAPERHRFQNGKRVAAFVS
jgi:hypothetical protein